MLTSIALTAGTVVLAVTALTLWHTVPREWCDRCRTPIPRGRRTCDDCAPKETP